MLQKLIAVLKDRERANAVPRTLAILMLAWAAALFLGFFATDLGGLSPAWFAALGLRALIIAGLFLSMKGYLLGDRVKGYRLFKAFIGYAVFFTYIAAGLYSYAAWETGSYSGARAWLGWSLTLVQTAPGMALYVLVCLNSSRAALGVISQKDLKNKYKWKPGKPKSIGGKIADNADAIIQAVIMVAVIHSTLFQLYVIPTESMVPKFLVNDRVIVTKAQAGPRIPLSPIKLPSLDTPARGDIIVYDNPFSQKPPILRRMLNTLTFYLSLSSLNLDKEDGQPRVGTVVKRLVGMPGEKVLMVDDVLYVKRPGDADWAALADDQKWARVDLWKEAAKVRGKIQVIRVDESARAKFTALDTIITAPTIPELSAKLKDLADRLKSIDPAEFRASLPSDSAAYFREAEAATFSDIAKTETESKGYFFRDRSFAPSWDVRLFLYAISSSERLDRFLSFLAAPAAYPAGLNPYQAYAAKLNLGLKINQAERWLAYLVLLKKGDSRGFSRIAALAAQLDTQAIAGLGEPFSRWMDLLDYLVFFDSRNFPEFPAAEGEYIPADRYFLMGDNRYNSLDFRFVHDYVSHQLAIDSSDPQSVRLRSLLDPTSLSRDRILGKVLFTFWPPSSLGR